MSDVTVDKAWLERQFTHALRLGGFVGFVFEALTMFLICHFKWGLLGG